MTAIGVGGPSGDAARVRDARPSRSTRSGMRCAACPIRRFRSCRSSSSASCAPSNGTATDAASSRVTPTYSGCPATEVIRDDIRERAARARRAATSRIDTRSSPAWTTDWIAPEGKRKLREFGIAPPARRSRRASTSPASARCAATGASCRVRAADRTRRRWSSQFGSTACKALYRCDACREPFDYFKPH